MSADVTFLPPPPQSTGLTSLSNPAPTGSLPPFASLQSPSLSFLPYLTDDSWLNVNNFLFQPPAASASSQPETQKNPSPTAQPSQIRKRRNNHPTRHADPPASPNKDREEAERRKRQNFLARNRRAATKCRERKREFTKKLESQYEEVSRRKQSLEGEFAQLQKEILELKNELLRHSQCADPAIQSHLASMVKNVTVANPPVVAPLGPAAVPGSETSGSVSSTVPSVDEDGMSTLAASSCETGRMRGDSVLSVSTDASLESFIDEGLFEEIFNFSS